MCVLMIVACEPAGDDPSGSEDDSDGTVVPDKHHVVSPACQRHAEHWCGRLWDCFPSSIESSTGTLENCIEINAQGCEDRVAAPDSTLGHEALNACIDADAQLQGCDVWWNTNVPECNLPAGLRAVGQSCLWDDECQSKNCSYDSEFEQCGSCVATAGEGEACPGAVTCTYDLVCAVSGDAPTCQRPLALGAQCGEGLPPCAGSAYCDGVCRANPHAGEPCRNGACTDWTSCNALTNTCEPAPVQPAGAACDFEGGEWSTCSAEAWCMDDKCLRVRQLGETCDTSGIPPCAHGYCIDGHCQLDHYDWCTPGNISERSIVGARRDAPSSSARGSGGKVIPW